MGEGAKHLGPDDTKIADAAQVVAERGEGAVEDVADEMGREAGYDGFTAFVAAKNHR